MSKPCVGIVLCSTVVPNQQTSCDYNLHFEGRLRLLFPNSGSNVWHRHHDLRQRRLFPLHPKVTFFAKRSYTAHKKLFHDVETFDDRHWLRESHHVHVIWVTLGRSICQIFQRGHRWSQRVIPLPSNISHWLRGHPAVKAIAIPAACPLVPHSRGKLRPPSVATRMKCDTTKLRNEGSLANPVLWFL
jgi:hypothetical protein